MAVGAATARGAARMAGRNTFAAGFARRSRGSGRRPYGADVGSAQGRAWDFRNKSGGSAARDAAWKRGWRDGLETIGTGALRQAIGDVSFERGQDYFARGTVR